MEVSFARAPTSCEPKRWLFNTIQFNDFSLPCSDILATLTFYSGSKASVEVLVDAAEEIISINIPTGERVFFEFGSYSEELLIDVFEGSQAATELETQANFGCRAYSGESLLYNICLNPKPSGGGYLEVLTSSVRIVVITVKKGDNTWVDRRSIETITFEKITVSGKCSKVKQKHISVSSRVKPSPIIEIKVRDKNNENLIQK